MLAVEEAVADASVLLAFIRRDAGEWQPVADSIYESFASGDVSLLLLDLIAYEVVNVLVRRHRLAADETAMVLAAIYDLSELVIRVDHALAARAAEIASATGLSGYDAAYLAAGERVSAPVLTLDKQLAASGGVHLRQLAAS